MSIEHLSMELLLAKWDEPERPEGWNAGNEHHLAASIIEGFRRLDAHTPAETSTWQDVAAFLERKGLADGGIADYIRENAPQGEPSDTQVLDGTEALRDLLDEMNEAGVMPELPFRDAQDIAGVAYLVDEGDTTRAVFLSDPGEDRVQYDGHSEDDASYVGLFERPIDELHGPIAVLRAAGGAR